MKSPWGTRGELCKAYGWTYDYLLWGISWINVNMMSADAARMETDSLDSEPVNKIELRTKEDIKQFITGN